MISTSGETPAAKSAGFTRRATWSQPLPGEDGAVILISPSASAAAANPAAAAAAMSPRQKSRNNRDACFPQSALNNDPSRDERIRPSQARQAGALSAGRVRLRLRSRAAHHGRLIHASQHRPTPSRQQVLARGDDLSWADPPRHGGCGSFEPSGHHARGGGGAGGGGRRGTHP